MLLLTPLLTAAAAAPAFACAAAVNTELDTTIFAPLLKVAAAPGPSFASAAAVSAE